jgi:glycosyltransferase involved in cell wall biosynthesis
MPEVSVIIPTRNRAQLLPRAIQSVLEQTFRDFELIIVDDQSEDSTQAVVEDFGNSRIVYVRKERKQGVSAARNAGILKAAGRFVAFLDDDDQWLPRKLESQVSLFSAGNPSLGVVYSGLFVVDFETGKVLQTRLPKKRGNVYEAILGASFTIIHPDVFLVRKVCFEEVGLFNESLRHGEDWEMWLRISKKFEFDFVNECLVKYCVHADRVSANLEASIKGNTMVLEAISKELASRSTYARRKIVSRHLFILGVLYCRNRCMREGRQKFLKAIVTFPLSLKYFLYLFLTYLSGSLWERIATVKRHFYGSGTYFR